MDWIGMIDLSIQVGAKKCLLVLGVQASVLLRKKPLTFEDVHVLHIELLEQTSGPIIYEALKRSEEKVGQYRQLCHDQGPDIVAGTRLYAQRAQTVEGKKIPIVHDIAHKIANLLAVEAEELGWAAFASMAAHMKKRLQLTKWAALCPPNQRSKARYMNLDELNGWARKMLAYLERAQEGRQQKAWKNPFGWEECKMTRQELFDQFGWIQFYEEMIKEMSALLLVGGIIRQKIRVEGMHKGTAEELEAALRKLNVGMRADQFTGKLLDFINEQVKEVEGVALGSTEIIESAFGKLKQLIDEDTKDGFTPFVLSLAACIGKIDLDVIQTALRTCNKQQVQAWAAENVGETIYSQRRRLFNPFKKRKKIQAQTLQIDREPNFAGIFSEQVVNL